jgi:hypothetical protein
MGLNKTSRGIKFSAIDITSQITSTVIVFVRIGIIEKLVNEIVSTTLKTPTSATLVDDKVSDVPETERKE